MIEDKSLDVLGDKMAQLRELFPEVISEGKVDFKRLRDVLGDEVAFHNEHYELSWAGKSEARAEIQKTTSATLIPDECGVEAEGCGNIFIEGENLEVLHVLQRSYFGKVKMIYIDPPYNTGNDSFVYPDDYSERQGDYKKRTGITNEEGFLNKQDLWKKNTKESGQFHSVWLSMMYPRLYLARNLLREDGVIFISIDDNEQANLKLLCDEVFGAENFIGQLAVQLNPRGRHLDKFVAKTHESILVFGKNCNNQNVMCGIEKEGRMIEEYNREDQIGKYRLLGLRNRNQAFNPETRSKLYYPLYVNQFNGGVSTVSDSEFTDEVWPDTPDGVKTCWTWGKDKVIADNKLLIAEKSGAEWRIYRKDYLVGDNGELATTLVKSLWTDKEISNDVGRKAIKELFENSVMDFPKSPELLKILLKTGNSTDGIVLDFFAGSGTTAHAVLNLNEQDGGNRQFICVQLPEALEENSEAYKAGYRTIADICKARIIKVIAKLAAERETATQNADLFTDTAPKQPLGFNSFKIAPSNFKKWRSDAENQDILEQLDLFRHSEKQDSENKNLLVELLLKSGRPLTAKVETTTIDGQELYNVESGSLLLFFDAYNSQVKEFIFDLKPKRVVCLDRVFKDDEALTNFQLNLKDADIELQII